MIIATPTPAFSPPDWRKYCKRARNALRHGRHYALDRSGRTYKLSGRYDEAVCAWCVSNATPSLPPTSGDSRR
ncbi:hypothetical protein KCP77_18705 [Salmonella enterica subsp. enterica]|nr:hypothetical protein KCP77_18705 [Salmonella enterica subsp. enterica]